MIEDFLHLPLVSLTPVAKLELRISTRIFEKIVIMVYSGSWGKPILEKKNRSRKFPDSIPLNIAWCNKTILQILGPWKRDGWKKIPQNVVYVLHFSLVCQLKGLAHGLINYIDTKAKCLHLKEVTCKGILRQVFIRIYRLEIQSVMLEFSTQLCELLPL